MLHIRLSDLQPASDVLAGAAVAEKHRDAIVTAVLTAKEDDPIVILDFESVEAVTASYLKLVIPIFYDENVLTKNKVPHPLYAQLSPETEEDLHHFLIARGWPGIVATWKRGKATFKKLIGALEAAPSETFRRLSKVGLGSAVDIMQSAGGTEVALTAWNNRLAELSRLRLARRERRGRFWIYRPTLEVTNNG
jgi:hypothetical protein